MSKTKASRDAKTSPQISTTECWLNIPSLDHAGDIEFSDASAELQFVVQNAGLSADQAKPLLKKAIRANAGLLKVRLTHSADLNWRAIEPTLARLVVDVFDLLLVESKDRLACRLVEGELDFSAELISDVHSVPDALRKSWCVPSEDDADVTPEAYAWADDDNLTKLDRAQRQAYSKLIFDGQEETLEGLNNWLDEQARRKSEIPSDDLELTVQAINFFANRFVGEICYRSGRRLLPCRLGVELNEKIGQTFSLEFAKRSENPGWKRRGFPPLHVLEIDEKTLEKRQELRHSRATKQGSLGGELPIKPLSPRSNELRQAFQQVSTLELSEIPIVELNLWRAEIDQARLRKARQMLDLKDGEKITATKMNRFFQQIQEQQLSREGKLLLSLLVSQFRGTGKHKLVISHAGRDVECSLTARFPKNASLGQIWIRGTGVPQESLHCRSEFPAGLKFVRT